AARAAAGYVYAARRPTSAARCAGSPASAGRFAARSAPVATPAISRRAWTEHVARCVTNMVFADELTLARSATPWRLLEDSGIELDGEFGGARVALEIRIPSGVVRIARVFDT